MELIYVNVFDLLHIRPPRQLVVKKLQKSLVFPCLADYSKKPEGLKLFARSARRYLDGSLILYKFSGNILWCHVAVIEVVCESLMEGSGQAIGSYIVEQTIIRCEEEISKLRKTDVVAYKMIASRQPQLLKGYQIFNRSKIWIGKLVNIIGETRPSSLFSSEYAMLTLIVNLVGVELILAESK